MDRGESKVSIGKLLTLRFAPAVLSSEGTWFNISQKVAGNRKNDKIPTFLMFLLTAAKMIQVLDRYFLVSDS